MSNWAAAKGVSEDIIAAVLLLHERSVEEIAPKLTAVELEQGKLVGRSPRVYPPGTLDALKKRRALVSPEPPQQSGESTRSEVAAEKRHAGTRGAWVAGGTFQLGQTIKQLVHELLLLRGHRGSPG